MHPVLRTELAEKIILAKAEVKLANERLRKLLNSCPHEDISRDGESAICAVCNKDFGWWCPDSPNNTCSYTKDLDQCDFCGNPEGRIYHTTFKTWVPASKCISWCQKV